MTKRLTVLVDDHVAICVGITEKEPKDQKKPEPTPVDAASHSLLLTMRAADSENNVINEPDKWFSNVIGKMGELAWRLMAKEIPASASGPVLPKSSYRDEIIDQLVKSLKETKSENDGPKIRKAVEAAIDVSDRYAGIDLGNPKPAALCRGVGHVFQGQEGPELALAYAWLQHTTAQPEVTKAPGLEDGCDSGSKLWILLWRGKLLDDYNHEEVVKALDEGLPGWQDKIFDVRDGE